MSDTPIMDAVVRPYIGNMDAACVAERDALLNKGRELERENRELREKIQVWKSCSKELNSAAISAVGYVSACGGIEGYTCRRLGAAIAAFDELIKVTSACSPQPESPSPPATRSPDRC